MFLSSSHQKIEVTNKSVFDLLSKTTEYLQPNPGKNRWIGYIVKEFAVLLSTTVTLPCKINLVFIVRSFSSQTEHAEYSV